MYCPTLEGKMFKNKLKLTNLPSKFSTPANSSPTPPTIWVKGSEIMMKVVKINVHNNSEGKPTAKSIQKWTEVLLCLREGVELIFRPFNGTVYFFHELCKEVSSIVRYIQRWTQNIPS